MSQLIDAHMSLADPYDEFQLVEPDDAGSYDGLLQALPPADGGGLRIAVPPLYHSRRRGFADIVALNDTMLWACRQPAVKAVGLVDPKCPDLAMAEIDRLAGAGFVGVVWSPRAQGVFGNDAIMVDLCRAVGDRGMVSMIHSAPYSTNEAFWRVVDIADRCPRAQIVVLGALASWENIGSIQALRPQPPNLWLDTSGLMDPRFLGMVLPHTDPARIVFGSGRAPDRGRSMRAHIEESPLPAATKEDILWRNAAKLFRLGL